MGDSLPYTDLGTGFVVDEISGGVYHCCALSTDRDLKCWGFNNYGELGYGSAVTQNECRGDQSGEMGNALGVVSLGSGFVVSQIELAGHSTCAMSTGGAIKCWGMNQFGQLG